MWKAKLKEKYFINGQAIILIEYQKGDDQKTAFVEKYNWADFPDDVKLGQIVHAQIERLKANEAKIDKLVIDQEITPIAPPSPKEIENKKESEEKPKKKFRKVYGVTYKYSDGTTKKISITDEDLPPSFILGDKYNDAYGQSLVSGDVKLIETKHTTELIKL